MSEVLIEEIMSLLPHRYPFLLIDRVLELTPGKSLVAIKNITINEPQFPGHFPKQAIFPGVLVIEAMAQAAAILGFKTSDTTLGKNQTYYLAGVDKARFKKPIIPGDQLRITIRLLRYKQAIWIFEGEGTVEQQRCAHATFLCTAKDLLPPKK